MESSWHGIITQQCVGKMLSNNTLLETRIQRLIDGLIIVEKELDMHMQRMLEMSRVLYNGGNFKQIVRKKIEGKLETLFTVMIWQIYYLVPTNILSK